MSKSHEQVDIYSRLREGIHLFRSIYFDMGNILRGKGHFEVSVRLELE